MQFNERLMTVRFMVERCRRTGAVAAIYLASLVIIMVVSIKRLN